MPEQINWRPSASIENLRLRARILATIRAFFAERQILEVETPVLSGATSVDPHLQSFETRYQGPYAPQGRMLYLQTSPEFAMKRLLAAGSGSIYQICKAFRDGEAGRCHNPEFTMLEWYRPGFDHFQLMDEVEALVKMVVGIEAIERCSYRELFLRYTGIDPFAGAVSDIRLYLKEHGVTPPQIFDEDRDDWLNLLLTHIIEPQLNAVFVYDFPVSQAMLARVRAGEFPVAERFELYINGLELANGFHELGDAKEQRERFNRDLERRQQMQLPGLPVDEALLAALEAGLPPCAGVALGVDRLVMLAAKGDALGEVLSFPINAV